MLKLLTLTVGRGRIPVFYRKRNARKPLKDWYPELGFVCLFPALTNALGTPVWKKVEICHNINPNI